MAKRKSDKIAEVTASRDEKNKEKEKQEKEKEKEKEHKSFTPVLDALLNKH